MSVIVADKPLQPKFHRLAALAAVAVELDLPSRGFSVRITTGGQAIRMYALAADTTADARYLIIPANSSIEYKMDFDYLAFRGTGVAAEVSVMTAHKMSAALSEVY